MISVLIGLVLIGYVAWCWYAFDTLLEWHRTAHGHHTRTQSIGDTHGYGGTLAGTHGDGDLRTHPGTHGDRDGNRRSIRTVHGDPRRRTIRRDYFGLSDSYRPRGRAAYIPDA